MENNNAMADKVVATVRAVKASSTKDHWLPVRLEGRQAAWLAPVTWADVDRPDSVATLAKWREGAADAFPSQFPVTLEGTKRWLIKQLLELDDRLLYWVTAMDGTRLGHVGLFHFQFPSRQVELDNIVRGEAGILPGVMYAAIQTLLEWTFETLDMHAVSLRVFSNNPRAIRLYERCGFHEASRTPMVCTREGDVIRWNEADASVDQTISRYFVNMLLPRRQWQAARMANVAA